MGLNGIPLQYSYLENPVDRGAWRAAAHRVAQSQTQLKRLSMRACIGEGMATHCSVLAWRIPGTGKPGGLLSMGSHRVGHDWSDLAAAATLCILGELYIKYLCVILMYELISGKCIWVCLWLLTGEIILRSLWESASCVIILSLVQIKFLFLPLHL